MCPWQTNIYAFDIAPSNNNILYIGTETGAYFKTTDAGLNWFQVAMNNNMGNSGGMAVHPTNPNIVLNIAGFNIYRSTDGGDTWTTVFTATNLWGNAISFHPIDPNIAIASTNLGIYRSADGGITWSLVLSNTCSDVVFNPGNPSVLYALRYNSATDFYDFYKSTNSGLSFSLSNAGWPTGITEGEGRIGVSPADINRVYCVILTSSGPYIMKSVDAGANWATAAIGSTTALEMNNGQGYYDLDITVSYNNANHLIVATTTAFKSTDGGSNYTVIGGYWGDFAIHPDVQEMRSINGNTWIATDGGMTYSSDFFTSTANASSRMKNVNGADFWGFDSGWQDDVLVGGRYHNGNTVWTDDYEGRFLRMGGAEAPTGYVNPVQSRHTYFSDLGGRNIPAEFDEDASSFNVGLWPNESYYTLHSSEMAWHPESYKTVFIGNGAGIYKSINEGQSYTLLFTSPDPGAVIQAIEISRSNPNVIYAVQRSNTLYDGKIWKTTNGGSTWTALPNITGTNGSERRVMQITLSGTNENEIWVALHSGNSSHKVYRSSNGGSTWTNKTTALIGSMTITDIIHQLGTDGGVYIAGTNGQVYYRNNSMAEWVVYNSGLPAGIGTVYLKPYYQGGVIRTGSNMGIWENELYETSAPMAQPTVDKISTECARDTFYFGDYSVIDLSTASWAWTFDGASYVSNPNERNPKVVYPGTGTYSVTLSITDINGSSTKTINNMVTVNGNACEVETIAGNSFKSTAAGQYLSAPPLNVTTNQLTLSAWIKPTGNQASFAGVIFSGSDGACGLNFLSGNRLGYHWQDGAGSYNWTGGPIAPVDQWIHVALVINPTSASVYLNGVAYTRSATHNAANFDTSFLLGIDRGNSSRTFLGEMDEVCIYNRSLSQNEIRELMHLTRNHPDGLQVSDPMLLEYYQMNESSGNIAYDRIGIRHASFVGSGSMNRVVSSAPVAGGVSQRITINTNGTKNFSSPQVSMVFGSGTLPNGEVVVSRLNALPDVLPNCPNYDAGNHYWIVNNYGSNQNFSALTSLNIQGIPVYEPTNVVYSSYSLQRRAFNASATPWTSVNNSNAGSSGDSGNLVFESGLNTFGQFYIQNSLMNQTVTGNTEVCQGSSTSLNIADVDGMTFNWTSQSGNVITNSSTYSCDVAIENNDVLTCEFSKNGCSGQAQITVNILASGCTNLNSPNYDPIAICDNGSCIMSCEGDFNNDGQRNITDMLILLSDFGCTSSCIADMNNDGIVGSSDHLEFLTVFGVICP
jgi:photosystem II stability/assembly factor-like uncharacterized protein